MPRRPQQNDWNVRKGIFMGQIGIIGGGASGLMAAIAAARAGEQVTVLEKRDRVGKKILVTGNGRCNLSNRDFDVERDYRSSADTAQLSGYFAQFGVEETLSFFARAGLSVTDRGGYLYPRSLQASSVLALLRGELERLGVEEICSCTVLGIQKKGRFCVSTDRGAFSFDRLILACGSSAGVSPKEGLGGFSWAKELGLSVQEPLPALTGLRCRESLFKSLAGVRCAGKVTLNVYAGRTEPEKDGQAGTHFGQGKRRAEETAPEASWQETGELQLTDYGISGIPVFQCSRHAAVALSKHKRVEAVLDFVPEYEEADWREFCVRQYHNCLGKSVLTLGCGILHRKIVQVLLERCGLKQNDVAGAETRKRIFSMFTLMRAFRVQVVSVNPMESAQVCAGGVSLSEVDERLEARRIPGLFLCGEMLDVDGRCGGYNLQWAWSSGYIAGCAAAKGMEKGNETKTRGRKRRHDQNTAVKA